MIKMYQSFSSKFQHSHYGADPEEVILNCVTCGHNVVGTGWGGSCSWHSSGSRGSLPLRDFRILATDLGVGNIQFKMSKKNV